jgi:hypothetical protein
VRLTYRYSRTLLAVEVGVPHTFRTSRQPIGISAAATCCTPRSVASRLNCAAAFLVSWISSRMPRLLRYFLIAGAMGVTRGPVPMISKSAITPVSQVRFPPPPERASNRRIMSYQASATPYPGAPTPRQAPPTGPSHSTAAPSSDRLLLRRLVWHLLSGATAATGRPRHRPAGLRTRRCAYCCSVQNPRSCRHQWTLRA